MVKSHLCWLNGKNPDELIEMGEDPKDFGGYFIVNGSEKALMTQEVLASDRVLISQSDKGCSAEVISTRGAFKGRVRILRTPEGLLYVSFPTSPKKLSLFSLFKALGLKTKKDIFDAFPEEKEVQNDLLLNWEECEINTEEEALDKIGKFVAPGQVIDYRLRRAREVIDGFLLPHIGQDEPARLAKAYYLSMMSTKAIERAYGLRGKDDKDHYANKRLELSGKLMEHLFRYSFKYFVKDIRFQIDRTVTRRRKLNISTIVRPGAVSERIRFAMSTGNWIGRSTGVAKFMDRVNYLAPLTDLRKVKSQLSKTRELYEARDVHGTHWGRLDPIETPDGPSCVAPETEIFLDDYSGTTIADYEKIWQTKGLVSVNWEEKKEVNSTIGRYVKNITPVALEVTTNTGRKIIATKDHPFYSEAKGKIALGELKEKERVAILPIKAIQNEKPLEKIILTEQDILNACPDKTDKEYILEELKKKNLVPFKSNNENILILSRLLGFVLGDGGLTKTMKKHKSNCGIHFAGRQGDLEEIKKDVEQLGFNTSKITEKQAKSILTDGRIILGTTTRMFSYSKPLWVLLKALGAIEGDKTANKMNVPEWIKNERLMVAKEFLSAYFGCEMTTPKTDKRNGKIMMPPVFSLNKTEELVQNGIGFAEEIKKMLEKFDVKVSKTTISYGIKRKSGKETRKIKCKIASTNNNLINLYGKIGFAYCKHRKSLARLATGYLLEKEATIQKRIQLQEKALNLNANGKGITQIFSELNSSEIKIHDIANWVKKNRKGMNKFVRVSEKKFPKFNDWIREHCLSEEGMVWETIETIKEVQCPDVRDVTTNENHHNFFANGFLTGNCGLVKNLCFMAEVTTEANEVPVEEYLHKQGVKLKKL
jgi:intein/homing endonuclease